MYFIRTAYEMRNKYILIDKTQMEEIICEMDVWY
jgi:hypothetical protein